MICQRLFAGKKNIKEMICQCPFAGEKKGDEYHPLYQTFVLDSCFSEVGLCNIREN